MAATLQDTSLVATLDPSYYADPSLLWKPAEPAAALAASVKGNQLTIQAPANASGSFQVTSDREQRHRFRQPVVHGFDQRRAPARADRQPDDDRGRHIGGHA